ncbi:XRE family transcriptional regulator [Gordonia malaquae]|uniref:helix-turn-helix domain-containing protein n=2 Tax=Gordonia TaxID=2053 RepID=UPI0030FF3687
MTQESLENDVDGLVRARIRGLRVAQGWTLDSLARRCHLSPSTLSRIETGHRRVALDQLVPIARALGTTLDHLVEPLDDRDVVIRPEPHQHPGVVTWMLSRDRAENGVVVAKMRLTPQPGVEPEQRVHPGYEWFTVLSGTVRLRLADRVIDVEAGEAAEFSTMVPHAFTAHRRVAEILTIFDRDGERAHLTAGQG